MATNECIIVESSYRVKKYNCNRVFANEDFFRLAWYLLMVGKGLCLDGDSRVMRIMTYMALLFASVGLLRIGVCYKEAKKIIVLVCLGVLVYLFGHKVTVLLSILLICLAKNQDLTKVIRVSFWIRMSLMVMVICINIYNGWENTYVYIYRHTVPELRSGMGIGHPNIAQLELFLVVAMYIYSYYERYNMWSCLTIIVIDYIFYKYTRSRTGLMIIILLAFLPVIYRKKYFKKIKKILNIFAINSYWIFAVISFILSVTFTKSKISQMLDYYVTSRFYSGYHYLKDYPFSLFGKYIEDRVITFPLDNSYVYTYVAFGIICFIVYIVGSTCLLKKYYRRLDDRKIIVMFAVAIYSITVNSFTNIIMNFTLLFFAECIFDNNDMISDNMKLNKS